MTKQEAICKLSEIAARVVSRGNGTRRADPERDHHDADVLLLEFIADADIKAAYDAITPKWYA